MGLENSPPLPSRLPHKAPIVQENHAIVSCLSPPTQGLPPPQCCRQHPGLELGSVRWEPRLREAKGTLPALHHHPDSGEESRELGVVGVPFLTPFLSHEPHPQLFPPLQNAGLGREQRLEQGQEAGSGAAGNAGSGGEGGEQGPGLLFHFFWKENWRKNSRLSPLPPGLQGIPLKLGQGVRVPSWLGLRGTAECWDLHPIVDERSGWGGWQTS